MSRSKVLFLLSGSISAYKAAHVVSRLCQDGNEVQCVATDSALKFIGRATLEGLSGRPVLSDLWQPGGSMDHIHLTRWADYAVLCPASANTLAKISVGLADDLVNALTLAWPMEKPYFIFPAMNPLMLAAAPTQFNLGQLEQRGFQVAPTGAGSLACGEHGEGRLIEPEQILQLLRKETLRLASATAAVNGSAPGSGSGQTSANETAASPSPSLGRVLVTAGATREPIDGIRFISNVSTGQTGACIADQLSALGWKVTFLHGHGAQIPSLVAHKVTFADFADLERKLKSELDQRDYQAVIHSAAVSDYSVESADPNVKLKSGEPMTIRLKPNPKLLQRLKSFSRHEGIKVIGFKLTLNVDENETLERAREILGRSVDAVVANEWSAVNSDRHRHPGMLVTREKVRNFGDLTELTKQIHSMLRTP